MRKIRLKISKKLSKNSISSKSSKSPKIPTYSFIKSERSRKIRKFNKKTTLQLDSRRTKDKIPHKQFQKNETNKHFHYRSVLKELPRENSIVSRNGSSLTGSSYSDFPMRGVSNDYGDEESTFSRAAKRSTLFEQFIKEEYADELINFKIEANSWRNLHGSVDSQMIKDKLIEICKEFIVNGSPQQINLSESMMRKILDSIVLDIIKEDLLDQAIEEVNKLMKNGSFVRYKNC